MIKIENRNGLFLLTLISAALVGIVSCLGIINPQVYLPMTPQEMIPGAVSQDIISLAAVIGLIVTIGAIKRGSNRAWLGSS